MEKLGIKGGSVNVRTSYQHLTTSRGTVDVALVTEQWNRGTHLREFIDRTSVHSIGLGGEKIHFTIADTPSSESRHIMLVQESDKTILRDDWQEGVIIHNQSEQARMLYWLSALVTLKHADDESSGTDDMVVFVENTCSQVSNHTARVPRSIGLVHGHVTRFPATMIDDGRTQDAQRLVQSELDSWKRGGDKFLEGIQDGCPDILFDNRGDFLPPGYSTHLQLTEDDFADAAKLDEILVKHHRAYTEVAAQVETIIPQPSYRTYLELESDSVCITISPILATHIGGITASGIFTNRVVDDAYEISERRRVDSHFVAIVGASVFKSLTENGHEPTVLRESYPY